MGNLKRVVPTILNFYFLENYVNLAIVTLIFYRCTSSHSFDVLSSSTLTPWKAQPCLTACNIST